MGDTLTSQAAAPVPPVQATTPGLGEDQTFIDREVPNPSEPRRKLVNRWRDRVTRARKHWEPVFKRMRDNMEFSEGRQWPDMPRDQRTRDERYIANICLRHILQRTAELYPNNPVMRAKRTPKLMGQTWDGSQQMLMQAQQASMMSMTVGMPPDPQSAMVLQDAMMTAQFDRLLDRIAKTLEILYEYQLREQPFDFKTCMKMTVRRAIVSGVGYVKLGFQRAMRMSPEIERRISDMSERLAHIERLSAELADDEIQPDSAEAEELRLAIQSLMQEPQIIIREGLTFDYPDSTAIIPDPRCRSLKGFVGADWVAQEYLLTPDEIEEVWMVDVCCSYTAYDDDGKSTGYQPAASLDHYRAGGGDDQRPGPQRACVWEIYSRKDGNVYVVCDGYPDFLIEPGPPETELERFWPWFAFVMNEGYDEKNLYTQSDIDLIRDMQLELNRARQGLREHRRANRPKTAVAAGILEEPDLEKLRTHPANALLELNALAPGQKIDDVLQPVKMPAIDPAVYDTAPVFEDVLRVLGSDPADQGNTSDATATEVSVATFSQNTDTSSVIDDLTDMMNFLARSASEVLMLNVSAETCMKVVGPGAVWPQLDRQTISENVYLEVDVGANGPPHRQEDVQMLVQLVPLLQRVPGISPEWLARQLIRRMGDDIDLTEAFAEGLPSMEAMNQLMGRPQPTAAPGQPGQAQEGAGKGPPRQGPPGADPNAQGPVGAAGGPLVPTGGGALGPHVPALQIYGRNGNRPGMGGGMPSGAMRNPGFPTP